MRISLFITCLADVLRPEAGQATVRLLRRLGHEVLFPAGQTCCGQPFYNSGFMDLALRQARNTITALEDSETIVLPSGSCAAMIKLEFPHLLRDEPAWHERALGLAGRTYELSDLLVNRLQLTDVGARFATKATYHYACHLRGLGLASECETLLRHVGGLTYLPLARADQCCGFGGSFAVRCSEISTAMVDDKVKCIEQTGADTVVSTDTGCLMNIGGRLHRQGSRVRPVHLAEVLEKNDEV